MEPLPIFRFRIWNSQNCAHWKQKIWGNTQGFAAYHCCNCSGVSITFWRPPISKNVFWFQIFRHIQKGLPKHWSCNWFCDNKTKRFWCIECIWWAIHAKLCKHCWTTSVWSCWLCHSTTGVDASLVYLFNFVLLVYQEPYSFFVMTNMWVTCNQTYGVCGEDPSVNCGGDCTQQCNNTNASGRKLLQLYL